MDYSIIEECPILTPTMAQFSNFRRYVQELDRKYKPNYGMVKNPIEQNTYGKGGIYECWHIPKKSISYQEFAAKAHEFDKLTQGKSSNDIEDMFWKNVTFSSPLYGADLPQSLMDESSGAWNLNKLDSLLNDCLDSKIRGVSTPYCYIGSWKAFFCWHTEDLDLSGINFIHKGKSKCWYAICKDDAHIIQNQARKLFAQHYVACKQFLRHKTSLINPYYLKKKYPELRITKVQHKQRQIMIVFGGAFHTGFNFGFNVAQAINYATMDWLKQLVSAKSCSCRKSSVSASIYTIYQNLQKISSVVNRIQFKMFQSFVYEQAQQDSDDLSQTKRQVCSIFSKKIKKSKKIPKKIVYQEEEYDVENWGQCQKCKEWRVVSEPLGDSEYFQCSIIGKECFKRQKKHKKMIELSLIA